MNDWRKFINGDSMKTHNKLKEFEIKIRCQNRIEPSQAFNDMCDFAGRDVGDDFERVRSRFFKMVLRPAEIPFQQFINQKSKLNNVNSPVFCIAVEDGYIFFGRYEP